eukprot:TRINITY_DN10466_c0_g2_i1.p1 TRINITY_DN10466_c0_g2~~TRINITY_DN10466_c0_g2_i1.p1  ORF type:complete len:465 (-),score=125.96 TRINITY_DN10466_c0_g2_i1:419-1813(-)
MLRSLVGSEMCIRDRYQRRVRGTTAHHAMLVLFCSRTRGMLRGNRGFRTLGLDPALISAVQATGLKSPSAIQRIAVPEILSARDLILAAETGSGKTLAYLLPTIQKTRTKELAGEGAARPKRPKAIVLVPSRELGTQVLRVAKSLSHRFPFRSMTLAAGKQKEQLEILERGVDLVVATPGRLRKMHARGQIFYSDVHTLVVDEVDTMLVEFENEVWPTLGALMNKCQLVLCGATLPEELEVAVKALANVSLKTVSTSKLHSLASAVEHRFEPVTKTGKLHKLHQVLEAGSSRKTMVFCNSVDTCREVERELVSAGFQTAALHGGMPGPMRAAAWDRFNSVGGKRLDGGRVEVLVCTDLAARGLDTKQIEHVLNYDFPQTVVQYVHRVGRMARLGQRQAGKVTSLITRYDRSLANQVESHTTRGGELEELKLRPKQKRQSKQRQKRLAAVLGKNRKGTGEVLLAY